MATAPRPAGASREPRPAAGPVARPSLRLAWAFASLVAMPAHHDAALGEIWLFSSLSASQLRTVRKAVEEVSVPPDTILVAEGAEGDEFSYIVEGTAAVRRNGRVVARLGPGQYFGELALLDDRPRSATVVSTGPMRLLVLDRRRFDALLDTMPALAGKLLQAMAQRLREADTRAFG